MKKILLLFIILASFNSYGESEDKDKVKEKNSTTSKKIKVYHVSRGSINIGIVTKEELKWLLNTEFYLVTKSNIKKVKPDTANIEILFDMDRTDFDIEYKLIFPKLKEQILFAFISYKELKINEVKFAENERMINEGDEELVYHQEIETVIKDNSYEKAKISIEKVFGHKTFWVHEMTDSHLFHEGEFLMSNIGTDAYGSKDVLGVFSIGKSRYMVFKTQDMTTGDELLILNLNSVKSSPSFKQPPIKWSENRGC